MREYIPYIIGGVLGFFGIKALKGMDYMKVNDSNDSDDDLPNIIVEEEEVIEEVIPDDYSEPPILIDNGQIYAGVIPDAFKPTLDQEHINVGGINLNDPANVIDLGYGNEWEVKDPIKLSTLQEFNIGAGANQFTIQVRHINALTYEFNVIQNYTGFIVNGIGWVINGEEFSSMFEPIMYQFPNAGTYDIDVEMFGGNQDFDDYSSDSGLQSELVLFTLEVSSPSSSEYSSGTEEVAFNDYTQYQSGL